MKKLFSIVRSAKMFPELHSDWPKLLFGSDALISGHRNLKCVLPHNKMRGIARKFTGAISQN